MPQIPHKQITGVRDGKAHCSCGWKSAFGGTYGEHTKNLQHDLVINELLALREKMAKFLTHQTPTYVMTSQSIRLIDDRIAELKRETDT